MFNLAFEGFAALAKCILDVFMGSPLQAGAFMRQVNANEPEVAMNGVKGVTNRLETATNGLFLPVTGAF
jgi:hypothetical protein